MKKTMLSMFAAMAATAAFAAANDVLITFSTPGQDKYADGTTVLDGERYALCWSKDFSQFKIKPDGTVEGGALVFAAPLAKGGRCPTTLFEVDADLVAKKYTGGEWAVYMLDTRKFGATGAVVSVGSMDTVNTFGAVGTSVAVATGSAGGLLGGVAGEAKAATGDVAAPEITGIRVFEGNVYVTVKGAPYLGYGLKEGATPAKVASDVADAKATASGEEEVTIVTPVKEGGAFFKVNRK